VTRRALLARRRLDSFTLVELLVVIAIIALMSTLFLPSMKSALQKARSMRCAGNLRLIGVAASQSATDNNNRYPEIDQAAASVYPPGTAGVTNLLGALGPYGVTTNTVECPVDMEAHPSAFSQYGSSYEWDPVFDSEPLNETAVYITPTIIIPVNSSRVRLAMDFNPIHRSRPNVVYGDGHVAAH
jgi:prepilin-type N-terminal cleavage/methylation domain-containing protein/prepilin-type processing-associated H-X9-DG protein